VNWRLSDCRRIDDEAGNDRLVNLAHVIYAKRWREGERQRPQLCARSAPRALATPKTVRSVPHLNVLRAVRHIRNTPPRPHVNSPFIAGVVAMPSRSSECRRRNFTIRRTRPTTPASACPSSCVPSIAEGARLHGARGATVCAVPQLNLAVRGEFTGDRLIVDKAVGVCGADGRRGLQYARSQHLRARHGFRNSPDHSPPQFELPMVCGQADILRSCDHDEFCSGLARSNAARMHLSNRSAPTGFCK
jgi:hypothetical protein